MTDAPSDQNRSPETNQRLKAAAASIFARRGIDFGAARRAGGWTNATWLAGGFALRLAVQPGQDKIRREAQLASLLPPEVGYPPVVETGVTDGYEWSLSREIPGKNLGEAWRELDWDTRTSALRQLWRKVQAVHNVDITAAAGLARERAWFNATSAEEAAACATRLAQRGILTSHQVGALGEALARFWKALPAAKRVLNHGDLTVENALWHEGQVVSLMDFEYAVIAPAELDLNELVKCAFAPGAENDAAPNSSAPGLQQLRQAVIELAQPVIAHPGGAELLMGYATLLELWMLEDWLAHPEGEGPLEQWQPLRMLVSLADGRGGYLAPVLCKGGSI